MIIGAANPVDQALQLGTYEQLKADHFLSRREIGIINIGGNGYVTVDGEKFELEKQDCLYIGKGKQKIIFAALIKSRRQNSSSSPALLTRNFQHG
jgi:4-deoxy-L-threo-5-hexosulose-uronate ketol-isomerase